MLFLPFQIGKESYALDCKYVVEIIPRIALQSNPYLPDYSSGLLNFGGLSIPVIDLRLLMEKKASENCLHTRIIILNVITAGGENLHLGIIGEKVTETIHLDQSFFIDTGIQMRNYSFLDGIYHVKDTSLQLLNVEELFKSLQGILFK